MKFKPLYIYILLSLAFIGSHAVVSPEVYWTSVLPNSHMPKAIKDLLYTKACHDGNEKVFTDASTYIKLEDDQPEPSYSRYAANDDVKDHPLQPLVWYSGSKNQLSDNELKDDPLAQLFFLQNNLHQGKEIKLHFMKNSQNTAFLPKNIADSIPFSPKDLQEIYKKFSVKPDSLKAAIMKQAVSLCNYKGIAGEEKFCATSLESMIDFATTKLGKNVKALSTEVTAKESTPSQGYKIDLVKKLTANKIVVCHRLNYPYAVFYCHISVGTQSYAVSLEGADGTRVRSVAVCHTDTSKWNPEHLAFHLLQVTPGAVPVCHFLPEDHDVLWVPY